MSCSPSLTKRTLFNGMNFASLALIMMAGVLIMGLPMMGFPMMTMALESASFQNLNTQSHQNDHQNKRPRSHGSQALWVDPSRDVQRVVVPLGQTRMIRFPEDVGEIVLSRPDVMEIVPRTHQIFMISALSIGTTTAIIYRKDGSEYGVITLHVAFNYASLETLFKDVLPNAHIRMSVLDTGLVLSGSVDEAGDLTILQDLVENFHQGKVVNLVRVQGREQVLLKVNIISVQRSLLRDIGFSFGVGLLDSQGSITSGFVTNPAAPGGLPGGAIGNISAPIGGLPNFFGGARLLAFMKLLEHSQIVDVLAEPTLITLSGKKASLRVGGVSQYTTINDKGYPVTEFREYGIILHFLPKIYDENHIVLEIDVENSEINGSGNRVNTQVGMASGSSFAIAGLINKSVSSQSAGVPFLKDIPYLGSLFSSQKTVQEEREVVFIITPYTISPVRPSHDDKTLLHLSPEMKETSLSSMFRATTIRSYHDTRRALPDTVSTMVGFLID